METIISDKERICIEFSRKTFLWGITGIIVCVAAYNALSDTLTMSAYYPSPYGAYANLLSTSNTWLARDSGKVGIGTRTPGAKLDVNGNVNINSAASPALSVTGSANISGAATIANLAASGVAYGGQGLKMGTVNQTCTAAIKGLIAFNTSTNGGAAQYCDGSGWKPLGGGIPPGTTIVVSGTNPSCPPGSTEVDRYYVATTCNGSSSGTCPGTSCTTQVGWSSDGTQGTCIYANGALGCRWQSNPYASRHGGPSGWMQCGYCSSSGSLSCKADSTRVQCVVN